MGVEVGVGVGVAVELELTGMIAVGVGVAVEVELVVPLVAGTGVGLGVAVGVLVNRLAQLTRYHASVGAMAVSVRELASHVVLLRDVTSAVQALSLNWFMLGGVRLPVVVISQAPGVME